MVDAGHGWKDDPVFTKVPPQLPVYHFQLVALLRLPLAILNVGHSPWHILFFVDESTGIVGEKQQSVAPLPPKGPPTFFKKMFVGLFEKLVTIKIK